MTKLTNVEKDKLDNTCGNLRVTKLGTHVKSLEDFVNEMQLDTQANTVAEAINELYHMFVNKDCSSIQIPPPGFFTLWGNDEDGKLYCYYNDKDHPPVFQHIEDDSSDLNGTLYLYIADPDGDNHYRLEVGQYIAVRHLNDYYKKTECDAKYPVTVEKQATAASGYAATYVVKQNGVQVGAKINIPKDFFLKNGSVKTCTSANVPVQGYNVGDTYLDMEINVNDGTETSKHMYILVKDLADVYTADEVSITLSNNNVFSIKDLGVSTAKLADNSVTTAKIKDGNVTNAKLATAVKNAISEKATVNYVDQQIANIEGDIEIDFASKADVNHTHFLDDINVTSVLTANDDLDDYKEVGIYTCTKTNSGTLANKPFSGNFACIIENKKYSTGNIIQFVYKITTNADTCYDTYFRCYTGSTWTDWVRIYTDKDMAKVNASNLKLNASSNVSIEDAINGKVDSNDSRLSDARTPKSHTHGNLSNGGEVGTAANKPLITGTGGLVQAGSFGTGANTFCQGNDSRLSDARTPLAHTHSLDDIEIKQTIPANSNLDDYIDTGIYTCSATNSGTLSNKPYASTYSCIVEVLNYSSNSCTQFVYMVATEKISATYVRNLVNGTWNDWQNISGQTRIPSNTNLNDYTNQGLYLCWTSANAKTVSNTPWGSNSSNATAFSMRVVNSAYSSATNWGCTQIIIPYTEDTYYIRHFYRGGASSEGTWSSWTKIATITSPVNDTLSFLNTQAMSGTVRYVENNGWATVYYEGVKCTVTHTSYTEFVQLPKACASSGVIYANFDLDNPQESILFRVEGGFLKGRCLVANRRVYGHITYPVAV